jgi:hypothetical protein
MLKTRIVVAALFIVIFLGLTAQAQVKKLDLFSAIESGDLAQVRALLDKGFDINFQNQEGETPLMAALSRGKLDIVEALLAKGADPNIPNNEGRTILMEAAGLEMPDLVKILLDKGAKVNLKDHEGETALMVASKWGYLNIVKALLEKGALVAARDKHGRTPLMFAAQGGHLEVVKVLLNQGAQINAEDKNQFPAISYAKGSNRLEVVNYLKDHGASDAPARIVAKKKAKKANGGGAKTAIPNFVPWPPPKPSAFATIPREFLVKSGTKTKVGDVADRLEKAFQQAGYGEKTWYAVPGGFALASRLEQFNPDGTPKGEPDRWSAQIKAPEIFGLKDVMRTLFTPQEGRYRIIVFIVTNQSFSAADEAVSAKEAGGWVQKGAFQLPQNIREVNYTPKHSCVALIYEFDQSTRDNPAVFKAPSELQGETHLKKAKIWSALGG